MRTKCFEYVCIGSGECALQSAEACKEANVIIPERALPWGRVTEIGAWAFRNNKCIISVVIPEGVVSIGENAFENCKNLEAVVLPQSLKTIGRNAFVRCESLKSVVLPPQVNAVAEGGFADCKSLESIDLSRVCSIGKNAFAGCSSLREVTLGEGLTQADASSFAKSGCCRSAEAGLLYVGKWIVGCNGSAGEYDLARDTAGIAADAFAEGHIKRAKNPEYDKAWEQFGVALELSNMPLPDVLNTPEYTEEVIPVKIRYRGTLEEWGRIAKPQGEKRIPVTVTAIDGTLEAHL